MKETTKYKKTIPAYFTVEAALVMPTILTCIFLIMIFLCYSYERAIVEQNACRLPLWMEYVSGYAGMYPEVREKFSKEEICRSVMGYLNETEKHAYVFGRDTFAELHIRGERIIAERSMIYPVLGDLRWEFEVTAFCLEPTDYLRLVRGIKEISGKEKND